ncbi:MAG: DUF481 domain-containing protein [Nannocystaceae bacterium]
MKTKGLYNMRVIIVGGCCMWVRQPPVFGLAVFWIAVLWCGTVWAGPSLGPAGTAGQAPASLGGTELDGQGTFATATTPTVADEAKHKDATEFTLSAGSILSMGNAEAAAVTGTSAFKLRRARHQFSANGAGNWGAGRSDDADWHDTVGNVQGRVRYDLFFAERWSGFVMATARHDRFQGLDLRLNVDPGVSLHGLPGPRNLLWLEAGYDFQFDLRTDEAIVAKDKNGRAILDASGSSLAVEEKTATNHAARIFAGYSNRMSKVAALDVGLEWLQSVLAADRFRFVADIGLTAQVSERLSVSTTFTLRYENEPLADVEKIDTVTAVNLVLRIL